MKNIGLQPAGLYRIWLALLCLCCGAAYADADVADALAKLRPGIVGVGSVHPTRAPPAQLKGTGFVVADGTLVVTCAHVVAAPLDTARLEKLAVFSGDARRPDIRTARVVALDAAHDLAILKFEGAPLPALALGDAAAVREGWQLYHTGYPLGPVLGLHPMTHRAGIAAIAPSFTPLISTAKLDARTLKQARDPFLVFALDAIAYPGNSGSPLWRPETGEVYGIVNAVFVKGAKEAALSAPSGIAYAIPVNYIQALLAQVRITP